MTNKNSTQWKFLKYNGVMNRKYKVSNHGEIVLAKDMTPLTQQDMQKKSPKNGSDYRSVTIPNVSKSVRVHRIVCETFHGKAPSGKNLVDHKDEYKNNNAASNLSWVSPKENSRLYYEKNTYARHSLAKISRVKKYINKGWTNDRIAQKVKMSDSNVSAIKLGYIHTAVQPSIAI